MARVIQLASNEGRIAKPKLLGYTAKWSDGKREWIVDPVSSKVVKMVFDLWTGGTGITDVTKAVNEFMRSARKPAWVEKEVWKMLSSIEYIGWTKNSKGKVVESKVYPLIIDREQFNRAQTLVRSYKRAQTGVRMRKASDELSAVISCADCGAPFKYRFQVKRRDGKKGVRKYPREIYFHKQGSKCPNETRTIYKRDLAPLMRALYEDVFSDSASLEKWKVLQLRELRDRLISNKATAAGARAKLAKVRKAKERLLDFAEQGRIPSEWSGERVEKLRKDEEALRRAIAEASKTYKAEAKRIENGNTLMFVAFAEFENASPNERRLLYKTLLKTRTLHNGILHLVWLNGVEHKINVRKPPRWFIETDRLQKQLDTVSESIEKETKEQIAAFKRRKAKRTQETKKR